METITTNTLKYFVRENTWLRGTFVSHGWGNGYVCIPPVHPCHGLSYNEIHDKYEIDVNGGLTFSASAKDCKDGWSDILEGCEDHWIVGFDTCNSWDTPEMWSESSVRHETERLLSQLDAIK